MRNLTMVAIALLIGAAGCKEQEQYEDQEAPQQQMKIDFTVRRNGNTLTLKAGEGAAWKELTYSCKELPCEFLLNDKGTNPSIPAEVFSISFIFSEGTVKMSSVNMAPKKGTAWETLSYSCDTKDCGFRVTHEGVTGL